LPVRSIGRDGDRERAGEPDEVLAARNGCQSAGQLLEFGQGKGRALASLRVGLVGHRP
jgi:hypothetical protein